MSQVINTNVLSLNAQRNLSTSGGELAQSLQRLSSGLRINSAKDDAAGLAISERFTTQIRGLNQAIRNSNDGISLSQTGEGALGEVTNNLQRIRELAVQSANATNSSSDREALNQEVQQRLAEIDRIATQTSFNGQNILDGSFGNASFQVGANVGEAITLELDASMRQGDIGAVATATSNDIGTLITDATDADPSTSGASGAFTDVVLTDTQTFSLTVDGETVFTLTAGGAGATVTAADIDAAIDPAALLAEGITVSGSAADGTLTFSRADGADFSIAVVNDGTGGFAGSDFATGTNAIDNGTEADAGDPLVLAAGDLTIQIGDADAVEVAGTFNTADEFLTAVNLALGNNATATVDSDTGVLSIVSGDDITIGGGEASNVFTGTEFGAGGSLETVNVSTVAAANDAIQRIDSALGSVSDLRSTFGAIQNRLESTIANLSSVVENLSASRSRIMDTDFAAETASLTRAQVLQQAGVAMLAQANAAPQNVLSLLR